MIVAKATERNHDIVHTISLPQPGDVLFQDTIHDWRTPRVRRLKESWNKERENK